jgi:hypothetical protein
MVRRSAALVFFAALVHTAMGADLRRVGVYLSFDSKPEPESVLVMKAAVDSLLKPAGIALAWRLINQNVGSEVVSH